MCRTSRATCRMDEQSSTDSAQHFPTPMTRPSKANASTATTRSRAQECNIMDMSLEQRLKRKRRAKVFAGDDDNIPGKKAKSIRSAGNQANSKPPPAQDFLAGYKLRKRIREAMDACSLIWPAGTQLWVKQRGMCHWPVLMWSLDLCMKKDIPQLLESYKDGHVMARFYGEHSSMWVSPDELSEMLPGSDDYQDRLRALKTHTKLKHKGPLVEAALEEVGEAHEDCGLEVQRMLQLHHDYTADEDAADICYHCQEEGASLACGHCERLMHPICLTPPCLSLAAMHNTSWDCPSCGQANVVGDASSITADKDKQIERMGLTPDWIIQATCFQVFQLKPPTPETPFIRGLLDPCTNSLLAPNIPAEKLYDKEVNGLKLSNSWAGYHILLNPDYSAQILWRFVNRAIDEVENDQVPAVLLVCRNSTDTAYFQRLRPYPRIMLRRMSALFKDYDKCPIGFGVVVFCIAKSTCRALYERFHDAFAHEGEPNIPIDRQVMQSQEFFDLLERLRQHAEQHQRDHWIECSLCGKWRIISYAKMSQAKDAVWACKLLRPPYSSCRTPQTKRELLGVRYAVQGVDAMCEEDDLAPLPPLGPLGLGPLPCRAAQNNPSPLTTLSPMAAVTPPARAQSPDPPEPSSLSPLSPMPAVTTPPARAVSAPVTPLTPLSPLNPSLQETPACSEQSPDSTPNSAVAPHGADSASGSSEAGSHGIAGNDLLSNGSLDSSSTVGPQSALQAAPVRPATAPVRPATAPVRPATAPVRPATAPARPETAPVKPETVRPSGLGTVPVPGEVEQTSFPSPAVAATDLKLAPATAARSETDAAMLDASSADASSPANAPDVLPTAANSAGDQPPEPRHDSRQQEPKLLLRTGDAHQALAEKHKQPDMRGKPESKHTLSAAEVVDAKALSKWVQLPTHRHKGRAGVETTSPEQPWKVLTALELARQARIAANRAFLASLQLGPQAMTEGQVTPLQAADPLVLAAARQLATKAALAQAQQQVEEAQRQLEARDKQRAREETRLKAALAALQVQAAADAQQLQAAKHTLQELVPDSQPPAPQSSDSVESEEEDESESQPPEAQSRMKKSASVCLAQQPSRVQQAWRAHQKRQAQQLESARQAQMVRQARQALEAQQAQYAQQAQQLQHYAQLVRHMWHANQTSGLRQKGIPALENAICPGAPQAVPASASKSAIRLDSRLTGAAASGPQQKQVLSSVAAKAAEQHLPAAVQSACLIEAGVVKAGTSFRLAPSSRLLPPKQPQQAGGEQLRASAARMPGGLNASPAMGTASAASPAGKPASAGNLSQHPSLSPAGVQARPAAGASQGHAYMKHLPARLGTALPLLAQNTGCPNWRASDAAPSTAAAVPMPPSAHAPHRSVSQGQQRASGYSSITPASGNPAGGKAIYHPSSLAAAATECASFHPLLCDAPTSAAPSVAVHIIPAPGSCFPATPPGKIGPGVPFWLADSSLQAMGSKARISMEGKQQQQPFAGDWTPVHPAGAFGRMLQTPLAQAMNQAQANHVARAQSQAQAAAEAIASRPHSDEQPPSKGLFEAGDYAPEGSCRGSGAILASKPASASELYPMPSKPAEQSGRCHVAPALFPVPAAAGSARDPAKLMLY